MTPTDLAWAAGFFDGEGCISIRQCARRSAQYRTLTSHDQFSLRIAVANRNPAPLDRFIALFGGVVSVRPHQSPTRGIAYALELYGAHAEAILRRLLPYLVVKAELAAVALAFREYQTSTPSRAGQGMSEERYARLAQYADEAKQLIRRYRCFTSRNQTTVGAGTSDSSDVGAGMV